MNGGLYASGLDLIPSLWARSRHGLRHAHGTDFVVCCPPYVKTGKWLNATASVESAAPSRARCPCHAWGTMRARLMARLRHGAGRSVVSAVPGGDGLDPDLALCASVESVDVNP